MRDAINCPCSSLVTVVRSALLSHICTFEFFFVAPTTSMESEESIVPLSGEIIDTFSESVDELFGVHELGATSII